MRYISSTRKAFTLIELLVVIGVIAVIASAGFALLGNRNTGTGLANAQFISVSMLNSARARAAATGRNARLLVAADTNVPTDYLRRLYVAYQDVDAVTSTVTWRLLDGGTPLPAPVYVVPEGLTTTQMVTGVPVFATEYRSNFSGSATISLTFSNIESRDFWYMEITPRGTLSGGPDRLVFSTAQISPPGSTPPGPRFENDQNLRGFRISTYGIPTLANDAASFK